MKDDLTERKFGLLSAVRPTVERIGGNVMWEWKCDCGNSVFRKTSSVMRSVNKGVVPSCGCVKAESGVSDHHKRNEKANDFVKQLFASSLHK